jgi:hypothetical protein
MNFDKVNDAFMYMICNESYSFPRLFNYLFVRDCNKLDEYSAKKAIEICFYYIAGEAKRGHVNIFTGFSPKEAMVFAEMYEEYYRWLFV